MSWQDELRRLDDDLAAGRISADDYRARRDQILSTAVSTGNEPAPAGGAEATTMMAPIQPDQPNPQLGDADKTQIVPGQSVGDSERTQSLGWQATPPDDSSATQVVPGVPPQSHAGSRPPRPAPSPPGGFPQPGQPPWQNEEELAAPWAGQEFPPLAPGGGGGFEDWGARQGPEVFESEKKSNTFKVVGIISLVVVLIGVAIGAYFFFRPDKNDANAGGDGKKTEENTKTSNPTTTQTPEGPVAKLPGEVNEHAADIDTFDKVVALKYLTKQEVTIYQRGKPKDAALGLSSDNGVQLIVLIVKESTPQTANTARNQLDMLQRTGFKMTKQQSQAGVLEAAGKTGAGDTIIRAHYVSDGQVVRIEAKGQNPDDVSQSFSDVLNAQLEKLAANG